MNPNIATIQTSDYLADEVYFLPVTPTLLNVSLKRKSRTACFSALAGRRHSTVASLWKTLASFAALGFEFSGHL